mmetsp:Transcript_40615/g.65885  ORF Transcript_40615/g.65885 Transcript_40615/m.65885 type:complete len:279 (+) Transcript_40615:2461-3297(+)
MGRGFVQLKSDRGGPSGKSTAPVVMHLHRRTEGGAHEHLGGGRRCKGERPVDRERGGPRACDEAALRRGDEDVAGPGDLHAQLLKGGLPPHGPLGDDPVHHLLQHPASSFSRQGKRHVRRRRVDVFSVRCLHFDPDGEQGPNLHVAGLLYNDEPCCHRERLALARFHDSSEIFGRCRQHITSARSVNEQIIKRHLPGVAHPCALATPQAHGRGLRLDGHRDQRVAGLYTAALRILHMHHHLHGMPHVGVTGLHRENKPSLDSDGGGHAVLDASRTGLG